MKDNWLTETANFWKGAPEVKNGTVKTADIRRKSFSSPATQVAEVEGTLTNTQRLLQFHHKAAEAPGDCRSETWFYYNLGKRLKKLYAQSTAPRDEGFKNFVWDYEHQNENERKKGAPSSAKILKELNGFLTEDTNRRGVDFGGVDDSAGRSMGVEHAGSI